MTFEASRLQSENGKLSESTFVQELRAVLPARGVHSCNRSTILCEAKFRDFDRGLRPDFQIRHNRCISWDERTARIRSH